MSCCGGQRRQLGGPAQAPRPVERHQTQDGLPDPRRLRSEATFEYRGATALTVRGPATGRLYSFQAPGARLAVDLRDRPGLATVPNLREV